MKIFSLLAIAGFCVSATSAFADTYEQLRLSCRIGGTMQTIWGAKSELPQKLKLSIKIAKSEQAVRATKVGLHLRTEWGTPLDTENGALVAEPVVEQTCDAGNGFVRKVTFSNVSISADLARRMLIRMGAGSVPDLSELTKTGRFDLSALVLNPTYLAYAGGCYANANVNAATQIHFDADHYEGLSYHIVVEGCNIQHFASDGTVRSFRGLEDPATPVVPVKKGH